MQWGLQAYTGGIMDFQPASLPADGQGNETFRGLLGGTITMPPIAEGAQRNIVLSAKGSLSLTA